MFTSSTTKKPSSPPPQPSREFEFHMTSNILHPPHPTPSPADDLFFNGQLLPLRLLKTTTTTTTTTPFESCNISPVTSCFPSGELNPDDYFFECSKEFVFEDSESQAKSSSSSSNNNKSWSRKLKLIKKASKAYLKSLFTKSGCSDNKECTNNGNSKSTKKTPFGQVQKAASFTKRIEGEKKKKKDEKSTVEDECGHRRSFSGTIKRRASGSSSSSTSTSSSSSSCSSSNSSSFSSVNSNGPSQMLKRSSSVNSDNDCSIQGAIAYCKKTQQVKGRKSVSEVELYLMSESSVDV